MVIIARDTKLKPGYKQTELGIIPQEWNVTILLNRTIDGITNGVFNDPTKVGRGYRLINVLDLYHGYNIDTKNLSRLEIPPAVFAKKKVKKGDLFFTRSSLTPDGIAFCNFCDEEADDITFDGHTMKITPNANVVNSAFLRLYCISKVARKYLISNAKQTTMTTIGQSELAQLPIPLPSIPEQRAIATALSDVDALIASLDKFIAKKRDIKHATMQQLLTGKTRLPRFSGEWQLFNLANNSILKARIGWQGLTTAEYLREGKFYLVTGTDFIDGKIDWDSCHFVDAKDMNKIKISNFRLVTFY